MISVLVAKLLIPLLATATTGIFVDNSVARTTKKSARDVLAAALSVTAPDGQPPKAVYLDGSSRGVPSAEARDTVKQGLLWKETIQYAQLRVGETCLVDWE
jgi:hypothetical protein